jgi:hypothetical protein
MAERDEAFLRHGVQPAQLLERRNVVVDPDVEAWIRLIALHEQRRRLPEQCAASNAWSSSETPRETS